MSLIIQINFPSKENFTYSVKISKYFKMELKNYLKLIEMLMIINFHCKILNRN